MTQTFSPRKKIAVVGAGAAGITAAYLLSQRHEVVLFEASPCLGGHAHAKTLVNDRGHEVPVDTAFLIFNEKTYPNFLKLIGRLGVLDRAIPAEMSSCFSDPAARFVYTLGNGIAPFLAHPQTLLNASFSRIIRDFLRFRKKAKRDLDTHQNISGFTVAQYLAGYSSDFSEKFVLPLTSAIWSMPPARMKDYPIEPLLRYFDNHQLLDGKSERVWRTFLGSSRTYTEAFRKQFKGRLALETPVQRILRDQNSARIVTLPETSRGTLQETYKFDDVVLATHADISLNLIDRPRAEEQGLLGAWRYQNNPVVLHTDSAQLHPNPKLWGSWNMRKVQNEYRISYYLNRLQKLEYKKPIILTLADDSEIDHAKIIERYNYRHPIFDHKSVAVQRALPSLNGQGSVHFCGSYFGYGFHEDAVRSAAEVAKNFGVDWNTHG